MRHRVEPIPPPLARAYNLDNSFYKKHTSVQGLEIVSSEAVSDYAHLESAV